MHSLRLTAPIIALGYFVAVGAASVHIAISSYAPWPDEMWGYHLSVGVYRGEPIRNVLTFPLFGLELPYVSGNYQGAYRTYLHLAFLALTGGAAEYQRYINLVLWLATGLAMAWAIKPVARGWLCAIPLLIAVSDPNYIVFMQTDMGPFLFQNLFTALSFGFLLRAVFGGGPREIALSLFFASAIVGDKLTGMPIAGGIGVACAIVAIRRYATMLAPRWIAVFAVALIVPVIPNIVFVARAGLSAVTSAALPDTMAERIARTATELGHMLIGNYSYMLAAIYRADHDVGVAHYYFAVAALAVVMACAVALYRTERQAPQVRALALLIVIFAVGCVLFIQVPGLGRPWNYLVFNPLIYFGMSAIIAWAVVTATMRRVTLALLIVALPINFALAQCNVFRELAYQASHDGKELASMAVTPLIEKLRQIGARNVVCIDYGPCPSINLLTAGALPIDDYAFAPELDKAVIETSLRKPGSVLVLREISGITDPAWDARIQRGTKWFRGLKDFPSVDVRLLEKIGDTQYTLGTIRRD